MKLMLVSVIFLCGDSTGGLFGSMWITRTPTRSGYSEFTEIKAILDG